MVLGWLVDQAGDPLEQLLKGSRGATEHQRLIVAADKLDGVVQTSSTTDDFGLDGIRPVGMDNGISDALGGEECDLFGFHNITFLGL